MKKFSIAGVLVLLSGLAGAVGASSPEAGDAPPGGVLRLSPTVRSSPLPSAAAQDISFLPSVSVSASSEMTVIAEAGMLQQAPRIVATAQGRGLVGKDDVIYVQGELQGAVEFSILRPGLHLRDAASDEYLGDEIRYLGVARLQRIAAAVGGLHAFVIEDARSEIAVGDRLSKRLSPTATPQKKVMPVVPVLLAASVEATIISIPEGTAHAAQIQLAGFNKGARDSVRADATFTLYATGSTLHEKTTRQLSGLSPEESGRLLILRVFDRVSYGLITQAAEPVQVGDKVRAPY